MTTFGQRLKEEREALGLSQEALAKKISPNKKQSFISNFETGARKGTASIIEIAHALHVDSYWLKTGRGVKHPEYRKGAMTADAPPAPIYDFKIQDDEITQEIIDIARRLDSVGKGMLLIRARDCAKERNEANKRNKASS